MKTKVLYITNLPVPYRMDYCNELGKLCELTVVFEARRFTSQKFNWVDDKSPNFEQIYLSEHFDSKKIKWKLLATQAIF